MTDREKLVELLQKYEKELCGMTVSYEKAAEWLVSKGVTVRQMQKPLTEEEVIAKPDVVWVEWSHGDIEPKIPSTIEMVGNRTLYCFTDDIFLWLSDHGKTWRCWADRPTEEERKAAGWGK